MSFEIVAEARAEQGRARSRKLRRSGRVPAVVYGGGKEPASITLGDLRLSWRALGILVIVLLLLFVIRLLQGAIDVASLIALPALLALCLVILWFRKSTREDTLLDGRIPLRLLPLTWTLAAGAFFFVMSVLVYNLPLIEVANLNQLTLIILGFTAYGMGWLPLICLVLGVRTAARMTRERRL